ncbi:MAG: DUF2798 domain-containing protein, partial [Calditerrivibrio sp.]|nr:DUF2798 domain-containing protein [Calditerrivibrio sp.]
MTQKQARLFTLGSMVIIMTAVVVFISTVVNFGFSDPNFWSRYFRGWLMAFIIAFPLVLVVLPPLQKYFHKFVK